MRFEFNSDSQESVIRAVFEDGDNYQGRRQEGPGTTIRYSGQDIVFDYGVQSIHPDLLGLLCMTIFYPFIGEEVTFPEPVSPRLEQAFKLAPFTSRLRFTNVDDSIEPYSGTRMVLSFGGGTDSSAVRVMFPEAFVVHEAHIKDDRLVPSDTHDVVRKLGSASGRVVTTNQRYVSSPGGWHGWTCSVATSLLMATDQDFGMILTGTTLSGTLLYGGARYWDRLAARTSHGFTGNHWQSAFNAIGIPMFSPVCGASQFLTMKLSLDLMNSGSVVYCMAQEGRACLRCSKCLRRDLVRTVVDPQHVVDWEAYDHPKMHSLLEKRPLPSGHIFSYARDHAVGLPRFVVSRVRDLAEVRTDWPMRVHQGTFDLCDENWRDVIAEGVLRHLETMEPDQVAEMESWDQNRQMAYANSWRGWGQRMRRHLRLGAGRARARAMGRRSRRQ